MPDRMPYRQRSLEEVTEDIFELRQKVSDLGKRIDGAPFVRADLHAEQLDRIRSELASVRSLTMWTLGILCTFIIGAIVTFALSAGTAGS